MSLFNPCNVSPTQNQPLPVLTNAVNDANDLHVRITGLLREVMKSVNKSLSTKSSSSVSLKKEDIEFYENQIKKLINEICESENCTDPTGKFLNIQGENAMHLLKQIQDTLHLANDDASISQSENTPVNNCQLNSSSSTSSSSFFARAMPSMSALFWPAVSTNIVKPLEISTPKIKEEARLSDENKGKVLSFLKTVTKLSSEEKEVQYESRYKEMEDLLKTLKDTKTAPECKFYINALNLIRDDLSKTIMHKLMMLIKPVREKISTEGIFRLSGSASIVNAIDKAFQEGRIDDLTQLLDKNNNDAHLCPCGLKRAIKYLALLSSQQQNKLIELSGKIGNKERKTILEGLKQVFSNTDASYTEAKKAQTKEVIKLLNLCSKNVKNKMSVNNLAIVIAPNFFDDEHMLEIKETTSIFEFVIQNYEAIFEDKNS